MNCPRYTHYLSGTSIMLSDAADSAGKSAVTWAIMSALTSSSGPLAGVVSKHSKPVVDLIGSLVGGWIGGGLANTTFTMAAVDFDLLWYLGEDRLLNAGYAVGPWKPGTNAIITSFTWPGHLDCDYKK